MKLFKKILRALLFVLIFFVLLFIVFYLLNPATEEVPKTVADNPSIPHLNLGGHIFHTEIYGPDTAKTVIVLHGGPGNDFRYLLPLEELAEAYQVVFYDQRGTGLSPRVPAEELNLETSLEDLLAMVRHCSPDRPVHIIGHSWGAMLGCYFTAQYPHLVDRVVLAEPGFLTSEMAGDFMERTNGFRVKMNPRNVLEMGKLFFQALHVRGPDQEAMKDYLFTNLVTLDIPDHPLNGYFCDGAATMSDLPRWRYGMTASMAIQQSGMDETGQINIDLISGIENYSDTVLLLSGACNALIGPDYQRKYVHYFPRHRFEIIEQAGHNLLIEQPAVCMSMIRRYFSRH